MNRYTITSDTQKHGMIIKSIDADTYPDALLTMDNIVDEMDGHFEKITNPPATLTFDELLSGQYGEFHNYADRGLRWQIILKTGWVYTGDIGNDEASRCSPMQKLDSVMFNY
jgi:hypothetical protein